MNMSSLALRNVIAGTAMAGTMAFASADMQAWCSAGVYCSSGPLAGYTVSCTCEGSGTCWQDWQAWCECDGFPRTLCNCDVGCS
jgi:hypothetical protein